MYACNVWATHRLYPIKFTAGGLSAFPTARFYGLENLSKFVASIRRFSSDEYLRCSRLSRRTKASWHAAR